MDQAAPPLARGAQVRSGSASYRARGLRRSSRSRRGPARSADGTDRSDAAGLDTGAGRGGAADDARDGAGQCGNTDRRTGRSLAVCQSAPADGLSRIGALGIFERGEHQTRQPTKAGNSAARRLLIEAAWSYRVPARVSRELRLRQEEQPRPIREIAWKAQLRLCARYHKLARSGKPANVVTAAIARELAGFIWAIGPRAPPAAG